MILCQVEGTVVCTVKHPKFAAKTLLVVQPIDEAGKPTGKSFVAVDHAQAGEGDRVLVLREGNGVRQVLKDPNLPIRSVIVGVVDRVDVG
ncbi:MAG: EutN/CcmL family microcompartment protein [Deltaproteobacteria bacterium]|nr:EutN/CcmL family microcompartment protein [Deltaproteobacteria bacterium]